MVYGHYDVQPPEPFELWKAPPCEPSIRGRSLFGRGACDNKGQNLAHLKAVEAYLKTGTELPCDLTFVIEGEEEVGSKSLEGFLQTHSAELRCDAVVVSDTGIPKIFPRSLALRGTLRRLKSSCAARRAISGIFGGAVQNLPALARLLAKVHDPGAHHRAGSTRRCPTHSLRAQTTRAIASTGEFRFLGVRTVRRTWLHARRTTHRAATFEINGLTSGYGAKSSDNCPAWATPARRASCRISTAKIIKASQFGKRHCRHYEELIKSARRTEAYMVSRRRQRAGALRTAEAFGYGGADS
jgi:acetylornithine deacetylase/succinyl-diaminopimelate desuccinylase-like protein